MSSPVIARNNKPSVSPAVSPVNGHDQQEQFSDTLRSALNSGEQRTLKQAMAEVSSASPNPEQPLASYELVSALCSTHGERLNGNGLSLHVHLEAPRILSIRPMTERSGYTIQLREGVRVVVGCDILAEGALDAPHKDSLLRLSYLLHFLQQFGAANGFKQSDAQAMISRASSKDLSGFSEYQRSIAELATSAEAELAAKFCGVLGKPRSAFGLIRTSVVDDESQRPVLSLGLRTTYVRFVAAAATGDSKNITLVIAKTDLTGEVLNPVFVGNEPRADIDPIWNALKVSPTIL